MTLDFSINSFQGLLSAIKEHKSSYDLNSKTFGFQYSIAINDHKIPIMNQEDFTQILRELLSDLIEGEKGKSGVYFKYWRRFDVKNDPENSVDQLSGLINLLRRGHFDRRMIIAAWDPRESVRLGITYCLMQFFVADGFLSSKLYQSSGKLSHVMHYDCGKAVLLTYILCHLTGLKPGTFIHSFGDLYLDVSIKDIEEKNPTFSKLKITGKCDHLEDLSIDNFLMESDLNMEISLTKGKEKSIYVPNGHEEYQYLNLIRNIIANGAHLMDRTLVGTISLFGPQMVFSLRDDVLPLITTKRVFHRAIIEELLWFIRGCTNSNHLAAKNVHIWDQNASKEFLTGIGLGHREPGDLGPVYGFQWRHFGATYRDMHADYSNEGYDQLGNVIRSIKENPFGETHLVSAWNPQDLPLMALPPCHCLMQFNVDINKELSCKLYQRAGDMGLGVPFNIASYAILTRMIAHITGYKPGSFIHSLGDAHVYNNHVDAVSLQIKREPKEFPKLRFKRQVTRIEDFQFDDFIIENYSPHPKIAMEMAV